MHKSSTDLRSIYKSSYYIAPHERGQRRSNKLQSMLGNPTEITVRACLANLISQIHNDFCKFVFTSVPNETGIK